MALLRAAVCVLLATLAAAAQNTSHIKYVHVIQVGLAILPSTLTLPDVCLGRPDLSLGRR